MFRVTLLAALTALMVYASPDRCRSEIITDSPSDEMTQTSRRSAAKQYLSTTEEPTRTRRSSSLISDTISPRQLDYRKDAAILGKPLEQPPEVETLPPAENPFTDDNVPAPPDVDLLNRDGVDRDNVDRSRPSAAPLDSIADAGRGIIPNMIGDFFGGGATTTTLAQTFTFDGIAGSLLSGGSNDPNASLGFNVAGSSANDLFTIGSGTLSSGRWQFGLAEPVPPTSAPIPTDPSFQYAGGTATRVQSPPSTATFADGDPWSLSYSYTKDIILPGGAGLNVGRQKLAEDVSPMPRDRVFVNYSLFKNTPIAQGGVDVNRFTPGFEKTFMSQMMSFEFRVPMSVTLDSDLLADGPADISQYELGDLYMAAKVLVWEGCNTAISAGLSITVPTADDTNIGLTNGTPLLNIQNESVHVMPFFGWLHRRNNFFTQGFFQVDLDANGDSVFVNQSLTNINNTLTKAGTLNDATFAYLDVAAGYWAYRPDACSAGRITGIAPVAEFHWNRSLQNTDFVQSGSFRVGQAQDVEVINATVGCVFEFFNTSTATIAYGTPLGGGTDRQFDGELRVLFNRYF